MSANNEISLADDPRFAGNVNGYTDTMRFKAMKRMVREMENSRPITRQKTEFVGNHTYVTREIFEDVNGVPFESIEISCDQDFFSGLVEENIRKELARQKETYSKANVRHPERK